MKLTPLQKKTFLRSFIGYSLAFIVIKMIVDRGMPETGIADLLLTAAGFGLIMGIVNIFISKRKGNKNQN